MSDSRELKVTILGDSKGAQQAFKQTEEGSSSMLSTLKSHAGALIAATSVSAIVAFGAKATSTFSDVGKEVLKLQRYTGGSAEEMSKLRFAAQESGVDVDQLGKGMGLLSKHLEANDKAARGLGVAFQDAHGKARPFNDVLLDIAERIKNMPNGVEKNALVLQTFGKAGMDLLPFLNRGRDGLRDLEAQAQKFGLVLNQGNLDAIKKNVAAHREFSAAMQGLQLQVGQYVLPILTQLTSFATGTLLPGISTVGATMKGLFGPGGALQGPLQSFGTVLSSLASFMGDHLALSLGAVGAALLAIAGPVAIVVAGLAAVATGAVYLYTHFEGVRDVLDQFAAGASQAFDAVASAVPVVVAAVGSALDSVGTWLEENRGTFEQWGAKLEEIFGRISDIIGSALIVIGGVITIGVAVISELWARFGDSLWGHIKTAVDAVIQIVSGALEVVQGIFDVFAGIFTGDWGRVWDGIKEIFGGVWNVIVGLLRASLDLMSAGIDGALAIISAAWSAAWNGIKDFFSGLWSEIKHLAAEAMGFLITQIANTVAHMLDLASHLPFVGGRFAGLADDIRRMAHDANVSLGNIQDKTVHVDAQIAYNTASHLYPGLAQAVAGVQRATGGPVPGVGSGDIVPLWAEPGEFVVRKAAVQAVGLPALEHLNAQGFAMGGYVDLSSRLPSSSAVAAWGSSISDIIDKKSHDLAVQYAKDHPMVVSSGGGLGATNGLNPEFLRRFEQWNASLGNILTITSGFRTRAEQEVLYARYLSGNGPLAAVPGTSQHEKGLAIDHSPASWGMDASAGGFGLKHPVSGEPWHVEPFDRGGTLLPEWNHVYNGTGAPEHLVPVGNAPGPIELVLELDGRTLGRVMIPHTIEELQTGAARGDRIRLNVVPA